VQRKKVNLGMCFVGRRFNREAPRIQSEKPPLLFH